VVSPRHRLARRKSVTLKDLEGQALILRESGSSPRRIVDEILKQRGISSQIIMETASTSAIKRIVEGGIGMAILSRQAVKKEVLAKTLKELPIVDAEIAYRFYLIHHKDKYFSRALKAFMDMSLELSPKLSTD